MKSKLCSRATRLGSIVSSAALLTALSVVAGTISYEGFDITPGEIDFTSGETSFGWKKDNASEMLSWWSWDEANNDLYHGVSDTGLTWPDLPTIGNAFEFHHEATQASNWTYRYLPKFYHYGSSGQLWMSALFNPKIDGEPSGGGFFQLCLADFHNAVYLGVANAVDHTVWSAGGERLKLNDVAGEKWGLSEVPIEDGETAFLVIHLDFENKTAAFYANPPVDVEDPGEPAAVFTMWSDMWFDKVMLWIANNGPAVEGEGADYTGSLVDEIRIGDTYSSVSAGADLTDPGGGNEDLIPPVITGPSGSPGDASSMASVEENTVSVGTLTADEPVTWEISGGQDADFFTIGKGTGGLSFADFPDYENPLDANGDNTYVVGIQAMDEAGNTSTQTITVTVLDVDDSGDITAPVITGPSGSAGNDFAEANVEENTTEVWPMTADEVVTWEITGGADAAQFTIGTDTGELSFASPPDYESPMDADGDNDYIVEVQAMDEAANTSTQTITVTVVDVEEGDGDWAFWTPDENGWIDTNEREGGFMGWINVSSAPWIYNLPLGKFIYLPEEFVTESGSWSYALLTGSTTAGGWAFWTPDANGWLDTNADDGNFLDWLNVVQKPWIYLQVWGRFVYLEEEMVTPSGSWFYALLTMPQAE